MAETVQNRQRLAIAVVLALLATFVVGAAPSWAAGVDEVHYTFTGSTSVAIDWRGAANDVRWGETTAYGQAATGQAPTWTPFSSTGPFWQAEIGGLTPGTTYHYSIGGGPDWTFHAPPTGSYRFDAVGDLGGTVNKTMLATTLDNIAADDPSFVLMAGDLTYANESGAGQPAVDQHFNDVMRFSTHAAYMPAWGNHEYESPGVDDLRNYKGRLLMPNAQTSPGSPAISCCGNDWGWWDSGPVRFITYPEPFSGAWTDWQSKVGPIMSQAQSNPNIKYIVTYGHRPAYSTGSHPGEAPLASILDGFGDAYSKYVLNINGHSHDYERFKPIHGVTHITVGAASSFVTPWAGTDPRTAFRAMHLSHLRVDVSATGLRLQSVCDQSDTGEDVTCASGTVLDQAVILPRSGLPGSAVINVPGDQPTIQAAVQAASSGDTILLAPGTHQGGVWVQDKSLTFASWYLATSDPAYIAQTIVSGYGANVCGGAAGCAGDAVLEFGGNADGSAVNGLTIMNGADGVRSSSRVDISHSRMTANIDGADFGNDASGTFSDNFFIANTDDGIDLNNRVDLTIVRNTIQDNGDDGIEFRMYPFTGPILNVDISDNRFIHNDSDGIQLIDSPGASSRVVRIERNLFTGTRKASIGCMADQNTTEDYSGAPLEERVYVLNNTFSGENYGLVGGANTIALNNLFSGLQASAVRRVGGSSISSYNLFWNNTINFEESVVDQATSVLSNPLLATNFTPQAGSPAIDAGTASFQWQGQTVLNLAPSSYVGSAPDLGAFEYSTGGPVPNQPPSVNAGPDQSITLPAGATLDGTVTDDGQPTPTLTTTWTQVSGPATTTFANPAAVDTTATFTAAGTYVLQLAASDGALTANDTIQVTVAPAPPPGAATLERRVGAGTDDAEESAAGAYSGSSSDLELVFDGSNQQVGLRFTALSIPTGATITKAYVQFEADEAQSEATTLLIQGQAADNPATFSSTNKISTRPRTTAQASWSPAPWTLVGEVGANQRTTDLSPVIQQIVSRPAWATGNALALIITGSGHRTARAYEGKPLGAPLLHIEYATGGPVPNQPPSVNAGPDQSITLPAGATLDGTVTDDGQPTPTLTTTWTQVSGPATTTFANPAAVDTTATFTAAGTYVLRLAASDGALTANDTIQVSVASAQAPTARLDVTPATGTPPLAVTANASASTDPQGQTLTYAYNFGDGTSIPTQPGATATHTYNTAGTYTVTVTVTNTSALTSAATATVTVTTPTPQPPTARLSVTPSTGAPPMAVTANASTSTDPQGQTLTYTFNFGDGTTIPAQPGATATHSYTTTGTFTITVTIANTSALTSTATATVTVTDTPPPTNAPAYVGQITTNYSLSTKTSGYITVWRPAGVQAGNLVVLTLQLSNTAPTGPVTATDDRGNSYTLASSTANTTGGRLVVLSGIAVQPLAVGARITATFPSSAGYRMVGDEFTGVTRVDTTTTATGTATTFSSGPTATTTTAREVVYGAVASFGGTATPTWATGWTAMASYAVVPNYLGRAYQLPTTTGSFNATGTATGSWLATTVTFAP